MYKYNGRVIRAGRSWETNEGVKHPANWMTWSDEEKAAAGLVWEDDPLPYDSRYYWSHGVPKALEDKLEVDENGDPLLDEKGNQVVTKGLKTQHIERVKEQANVMLRATDWKIIRAMEIPSKPPSPEVTAHRIAIRNKSGQHEAAILACTTVEELAALQFDWPEEV